MEGKSDMLRRVPYTRRDALKAEVRVSAVARREGGSPGNGKGAAEEIRREGDFFPNQCAGSEIREKVSYDTVEIGRYAANGKVAGETVFLLFQTDIDVGEAEGACPEG